MGRLRFEHSIAIQRDREGIVRIEAEIPCGGGRQVPVDGPPAGSGGPGIVQRQGAGENASVGSCVNDACGTVRSQGVNSRLRKQAGDIIPEQTSVHCAEDPETSNCQRRLRSFVVYPNPFHRRPHTLGCQRPVRAVVPGGIEVSVCRAAVQGAGSLSRSRNPDPRPGYACNQSCFLVSQGTRCGLPDARFQRNLRIVIQQQRSASGQAARREIRQIFVQAVPRHAAVQRSPHPEAVCRADIFRVVGRDCEGSEAVAED